jgi:hypothetical protein
MTSSAKPPASPSHTPASPRTPTHLPCGVGLALPKLAFASVLAETAPQLPKAPTAPLSTVKQPAPLVSVHTAGDDRRAHHDDGALDPMARQAAQLAPPVASTAEVRTGSAAEPEVRARMSLEDLVPELVKKIAWSGDARGGTVRMELGAGELAGSTLIVSSENGRVSVNVQAPAGTDRAAWRDRLATRLTARGLSIDSVEVT